MTRRSLRNNSEIPSPCPSMHRYFHGERTGGAITMPLLASAELALKIP